MSDERRSWFDCPSRDRCGCINASCCWYVVSGTEADQLRRARAEITALTKEVARLNREAQDWHDEAAKLAGDKKALTKERDRAMAVVQAARSVVSEYNHGFLPDRLQKAIDDLDAAFDTRDQERGD